MLDHCSTKHQDPVQSQQVIVGESETQREHLDLSENHGKHKTGWGCLHSQPSVPCSVPNCLSACHTVTSHVSPSQLCPYLTWASGGLRI